MDTPTHLESGILLVPRPFEHSPGRLLLLPLLPSRKSYPSLPAEVWSLIFFYALDLQWKASEYRYVGANAEAHEYVSNSWEMNLLLVCKGFTNIVLPILYSHVQLRRLTALERLTARLLAADSKWDSLRRSPYSFPGRWVVSLDISHLSQLKGKNALALDTFLTQLFPVTPFLAAITLDPGYIMSQRAITALADRNEIVHLRVLKGIGYRYADSTSADEDISIMNDPFVYLLQRAVNLEVLDVVGSGLDPDYEIPLIPLIETEADPPSENSIVLSCSPLRLPRLRTLVLFSMHRSPLMLALLSTPLPSLRKLALTPYNDIPYPFSYSTRMIEIHGKALAHLFFYTPRTWPTRLHPSPDKLMELCPNLWHLSLETPLPKLSLPAAAPLLPPPPLPSLSPQPPTTSRVSIQSPPSRWSIGEYEETTTTPPPTDLTIHTYPLQFLSLPRPQTNFLRVIEDLLPRLPYLRAVRMRDVRWLRRGMTPHAQGAGVQGEMREWRRRLARRGVMLVDADWKDCE